MDKHLEEFTQEIEDLDLQLDLDIEKAPEAFEEQKNKLNALIDQAKNSLDNLGLGEKTTELQTHLDEMRVQAALGRAESRDAFEEQSKKINSSIHKLSMDAKNLTESADEKVSSWQKEFEASLEKAQTRLDVLKVHFHLGMADTKEEYETKRKELKTQLSSMRTRAAQKAEKREEKVEDFVEEMGEAFGHFKRGIRNLFS